MTAYRKVLTKPLAFAIFVLSTSVIISCSDRPGAFKAISYLDNIEGLKAQEKKELEEPCTGPCLSANHIVSPEKNSKDQVTQEVVVRFKGLSINDTSNADINGQFEIYSVVSATNQSREKVLGRISLGRYNSGSNNDVNLKGKDFNVSVSDANLKTALKDLGREGNSSDIRLRLEVFINRSGSTSGWLDGQQNMSLKTLEHTLSISSDGKIKIGPQQDVTSDALDTGLKSARTNLSKKKREELRQQAEQARLAESSQTGDQPQIDSTATTAVVEPPTIESSDASVSETTDTTPVPNNIDSSGVTSTSTATENVETREATPTATASADTLSDPQAIGDDAAETSASDDDDSDKARASSDTETIEPVIYHATTEGDLPQGIDSSSDELQPVPSSAAETNDGSQQQSLEELLRDNAARTSTLGSPSQSEESGAEQEASDTNKITESALVRPEMRFEYEIVTRNRLKIVDPLAQTKKNQLVCLAHDSRANKTLRLFISNDLLAVTEATAEMLQNSSVLSATPQKYQSGYYFWEHKVKQGGRDLVRARGLQDSDDLANLSLRKTITAKGNQKGCEVANVTSLKDINLTIKINKNEILNGCCAESEYPENPQFKSEE